MAAKTAIEWTRNADGSPGATWNPVVGCTLLSPGCTNCYAMGMARRIVAMAEADGRATHYAGTVEVRKGKPVWTGELRLAPEAILLAPLRRKRPTTYFVNSMGDLFHEGVDDATVDLIFAIMALCPQHTFQVLTKRAARMRAYMATPDRKRTIAERVMCVSTALMRTAGTHKAGVKLDHFSACFAGVGPFRNIWLGVSAERQREADERVPELLATSAAVRFVSAEPLLGPIDFVSTLGGTLWIGGQRGCGGTHRHGGRAGEVIHGILHEVNPTLLHHHHDDRCGPGLDWIIVGGESGPGARPMHPAWARSIRDQCAAAGTAFFFKQWGEHGPEGLCGERVVIEDATGCFSRDPLPNGIGRHPSEGLSVVYRVGKARAGRLLDGVQHNGMPEMRRG